MLNILFINHKIQECGVYQYGFRIGNIIKKSKNYNFIYKEIDSIDEYYSCIKEYNPNSIIYNNHGPVMPWLSKSLIMEIKNVNHIGIIHENNGTEHMSYGYNFFITQDSTLEDNYPVFSSLRPLIDKPNLEYKKNNILTINSFGFSFNDKGYDKIINLVCSQFDEAIINLHIPSAFFDRPKEETTKVINDCYNALSKPNIKLNISREFLSNEDLLIFLSNSDINIFLYDEHRGRGLSSVIDYALSVDRPIAITKSDMFRHIYNANPSICVEDSPLIDILNNNTNSLKEYKEKWSNENFLKKYEYIIETINKN
jgi:hypothetical protein